MLASRANVRRLLGGHTLTIVSIACLDIGCGRLGFGSHALSDGGWDATVDAGSAQLDGSRLDGYVSDARVDSAIDACLPRLEICDGVDDDCDGVADDGCSAAVASVVSGNAFACARTRAGRWYCWGDNSRGQLGDGSTTVHPAPVPLLGAFTTVAAGGDHACAIDGVGAVSCWGANDVGQLGLGVIDADSHPTPAVVPTLAPATVVAAGFHISCAILGDTTVRCWGARRSGALGDGMTSGFAASPVLVLDVGDARGLAVGGPSCAIAGIPAPGELRCWGGGRLMPAAVLNMPAVTSASSGDGHVCGISTDGHLHCFGRNQSGELGLGFLDPAPVTEPWMAAQGYGADVISASAGNEFTCIAEGDGRVRCWGSNRYHELGRETGGDDDPSEAVVPTVEGAILVETGAYNAYAVTSRGELWGWGRNDLGQVGIGDADPTDQPPTPIVIPDP